MKKNISILGCGWLGRALGIDLIQKGYDVKGSTTSKDKLSTLVSHGIQSYLIDIGKDTLNVSEFLVADILVIAITSKSIDDFKNLILEIEKSPIKKIIFISSTSVYPNTNGVVTEACPLKISPLSEIEDLFRTNKQLDTTILRFGGLFGYARQPGNFIKPNKQIENPEGYINFIHRDDCIQIIEEIIANEIWNTTLNACADSHPRRRDFYTKELKKKGVLAPSFNEESPNAYKIVSSEKLKTLLNYHFKYGDLMNY